MTKLEKKKNATIASENPKSAPKEPAQCYEHVPGPLPNTNKTMPQTPDYISKPTKTLNLKIYPIAN